MDLLDRIRNIFPSWDAIPESERPKVPILSREYLVGGEVRAWDGPLEPVRSCVCSPGKGGPVPIELGGFPLFSAREALECLDAACRAYDQGRGPWPTLPVSARIRHVEEFAWRFKEKRPEVVQLLINGKVDRKCSRGRPGRSGPSRSGMRAARDREAPLHRRS